MNDEQELIKRLIAHDETAFQAIYKIYVKRIHRFVFNYIKAKDDVNDICQTIFIKLWERRHRIDIEKPFRAYIFSLSYTAVMDYFRKQAKVMDYGLSDGFFNDTLAAQEQTDDLIIYKQMSSLYEQAILQLPEKRREIFILSRHHGLSNKEIAAALGISVKTVENQMTAALAALKNFLAGAGMLAFFFFLL